MASALAIRAERLSPTLNEDNKDNRNNDWPRRAAMKARVIIGAILAALLLLMQYRLWIGEDSLPDAWALQKKVAAQKTENERLGARNDDLSAEVRDLKQGHDAIEARARKELGMVKSGETFYQIIRPRTAIQKPADAHSSADKQHQEDNATH